MTRTARPLADKFWENVEKTDSCWLWTGRRNLNGYGHLRTGSGSRKTERTFLAHRFAYELLVAPIAPGLQIDHLCRVRNCVNPAHLEPVTPAENTRRGAPANKTECGYGHAYTPENTYRPPVNGRRSCRACRRLADARFRAARKQAVA